MMSDECRELPNLYLEVDHDPEDRQTMMAALLDYQNTFPAMREAKSIMLELSQLSPGKKALDAECGLGDDTRELASIVGDSGQAIGIDSS